MKISNLFFSLALPILGMVLLAQAEDTAKYEACVKTQSCMEYSSLSTSCGVDDDIDLTTPRLISSDQLLCLCLSGEFVKAISTCLECVGYSSTPWKSACPPSKSSSSTTSSRISSSASSSNSSSTDTAESIFGNDDEDEPLLGLNDGWSPQNTGIIVGSCFGGITLIAVVGIIICIFRRKKHAKNNQVVKESLEDDEGAGHDDEPEGSEDGMHVAPVVEPMVPTDPELGGRAHRGRREGGRKHRGTRESSRARENSHSPPRPPPDARRHPSVRRTYDV
ncbi:hypothetical protein Q9L58_008016 [Maublancomyces gigas]|uniref:Uncharacterized protein n=1 Tax=Discina gigas TaxID=1032678 RepID=A0ABR3GC26_9PEZI